jgi:hypothetical protein
MATGVGQASASCRTREASSHPEAPLLLQSCMRGPRAASCCPGRHHTLHQPEITAAPEFSMRSRLTTQPSIIESSVTRPRGMTVFSNGGSVPWCSGPWEMGAASWREGAARPGTNEGRPRIEGVAWLSAGLSCSIAVDGWQLMCT